MALLPIPVPALWWCRALAHRTEHCLANKSFCMCAAQPRYASPHFMLPIALWFEVPPLPLLYKYVEVEAQGLRKAKAWAEGHTAWAWS